MRFLTTITIGIDLNDCISACSDDESILHLIRVKYEKRCFMGMFIEHVEKIKTQGDCVISQFGSASLGTLSVICTVTALIYNPDTIITGCIVKNKDKSGIMICESLNTRITIKNHHLFESINIGQTICARVGKSRYHPGSVIIAVNAFPFLPLHTRPIYKLGAVNSADILLLENTINEMKNEEELTKQAKINSAKGWDFFSQLLYAFNNKQKIPINVEEVNIVDLLQESIHPQYISRDPKIELSRPVVYKYNDITDNGEREFIEFPPVAVIMDMINDYVSHLQLIREMITVYADEKTLLGHKNLWQIYKKNKK